MGTEIKEFRRNSRFRIFWKSKVSSLGSVHRTSYSFFYASRGRGFFILGLFLAQRSFNDMGFLGPGEALWISPKILGLNVGMFGIVFGQSRILLRIGFCPGTDVFGFRCVFWCLGLFFAQAGNGKVD